jgi:hypothetical protein
MKITLDPVGTIKGLYYHVKVNKNHVGDIFRDVDGFYYFEPIQNSSGFYSEEYLGALLFELQQLNAPWKETIRKYFEEEIKENG